MLLGIEDTDPKPNPHPHFINLDRFKVSWWNLRDQKIETKLYRNPFFILYDESTMLRDGEAFDFRLCLTDIREW